MLQTLREASLFGTNSEVPVILYPDFYPLGQFGLSLASENEGCCPSIHWEKVSEECSVGEVASSLLLALSVGTHVTNNLHNGVTHILCDLLEPTLKWHSKISIRAFRDSNRGSLLIRRLLEMEKQLNALNITLISPEWIRKKII